MTTVNPGHVHSNQTLSSYISFRFDWSNVAWYRRLWAVVKLPYDIMRLIVVGDCSMGKFNNPPAARG